MVITDNFLISFGKHKGKRIGDVPASYLIWFYEQDWAEKWPDVYSYCKENYNCLIAEVDEQKETARICREEASEIDIY